MKFAPGDRVKIAPHTRRRIAERVKLLDDYTADELAVAEAVARDRGTVVLSIDENRVLVEWDASGERYEVHESGIEKLDPVEWLGELA